MPKGLAAHVNLDRVKAPPVFGWLQKAGGMSEPEMLRTFNCGIGMVVVAERARAEEVLAVFRDCGEQAEIIGEVEPGRGVKSEAKGMGEREAVRFSGSLRVAM